MVNSGNKTRSRKKIKLVLLLYLKICLCGQRNKYGTTATEITQNMSFVTFLSDN